MRSVRALAIAVPAAMYVPTGGLTVNGGAHRATEAAIAVEPSTPLTAPQTLH